MRTARVSTKSHARHFLPPVLRRASSESLFHGRVVNEKGPDVQTHLHAFAAFYYYVRGTPDTPAVPNCRVRWFWAERRAATSELPPPRLVLVFRSVRLNSAGLCGVIASPWKSTNSLSRILCVGTVGESHEYSNAADGVSRAYRRPKCLDARCKTGP